MRLRNSAPIDSNPGPLQNWLPVVRVTGEGTAVGPELAAGAAPGALVAAGAQAANTTPPVAVPAILRNVRRDMLRVIIFYSSIKLNRAVTGSARTLENYNDLDREIRQFLQSLFASIYLVNIFTYIKFKVSCSSTFYTFLFQKSSTTWCKTSPPHHLLTISHKCHFYFDTSFRLDSYGHQHFLFNRRKPNCQQLQP